MTAVAFRHARFEEDDEFNEWVASLTGGEPVERGTMVDPAAMQVEMPDIPVAGSGEKANEAEKEVAANLDERPQEVNDEAGDEQPGERPPTF